jgi:hypothetical protein
MTQAFATRMPRGYSWVWLAIVAVALIPSFLAAQSPPTAKDDKKPPVEEEKGDEPAPPPPPTDQVFVDPNAKKALTVFNELYHRGMDLKLAVANDDLAKIQGMAGRSTNIDPDFIKRYVEYFAIQLTRKENLNAVLNPTAPARPNDPKDPSRGLERAVDALNKPIINGKANDNKDFLAIYYRTLFESTLVKLVETNHNYLTRIDAMIVLGMAGNTNPSALNFYIDQLKKPDQLWWVKLWAARGLTIATQQGSVDIDAAKANLATEALVGLLESDPKLPWPVQMRAIEALGSLRVATAKLAKGPIDAASVVMRFLADPEANRMVRAWSAWALGMMKVPASVSPYNFSLVGQEIGELAVELGNQVVEEYDDNAADFDNKKDKATQLTSLLIFQVCPSLMGVEGVRDSGLLHSSHKNAGEAKSFLTKVDDKVKAVSRASYELLRSLGDGNKKARNELDAKLADLKSLLAGTSPKERHLVPGGPEFTANTAQVAGATRP